MTLALGRICTGGLIIAADTKMTWDDGSTYDAIKVKSEVTDNGVYVIASSSVDGNAADTVVSQLMLDLRRIDPKSLIGVEQTVKAALTDWYSAFRGNPLVQLLVGVFIPPNPAFSNRHGLRLYFCEPPNTIARKMPSDSSRGYIAVGAGLKIADPLFKILFDSPVSPRVCLGQISYLMYRAKKDCGAYCGGQTDAVFLKETHAEPTWIKRLDMACAESFGPHLDKALGRTASAVISETEGADTKAVLDLASDISFQGLAYRRVQFHSRAGEEI